MIKIEKEWKKLKMNEEEWKKIKEEWKKLRRNGKN